MTSRRRGLGGVPLHQEPLPHPFESEVLGRQIDLNSEDARDRLRNSAAFRAEVDAYISRLVSRNESSSKAPLVGVMPLLPRQRVRPNVVRVDLDPEPTTPPLSETEEQRVSNEVDRRLDEIEGEIVE